MMYKYIKEFLDHVHNLIPAGKNQHHAITLRDDGFLSLTLFIGDVYQSVILQPDDFNESPLELAEQVKIFVEL